MVRCIEGAHHLSVPDTAGRYYVFPIYDMWTDVFAALGKRTSGTGAGNYAVVSPNWKGRLPKGVERIETPTPTCWIIVRTQTNGPKDYEAVHKVQDGYKLKAWLPGGASTDFLLEEHLDLAMDYDTIGRAGSRIEFHKFCLRHGFGWQSLHQEPAVPNPPSGTREHEREW